MNVTARVETFDASNVYPGATLGPLHRVVLNVPDVGTFTYKPLASSNKAQAIARVACGADPYHLSMMLCSKGWTKR
jgi:hypothetical protein